MKNKYTKLMDIAFGVALGRRELQKQTYYLAAAGTRADGTTVVSFNGNPKHVMWESHAETRLIKKLTPGSIVAVIRVHASGEYAMAKPCESCELLLRRAGVKKVFYSIGPGQYGILNFQ